MKEIAAEAAAVRPLRVREGPTPRRACAKVGYALKLPHVDEIPDDAISFYDSGAFTDMCEGPHVPDTVVARRRQGALGQRRPLARRRERASRCSASTAPPSSRQEDLDAHLKRLEEAKLRDHRKIGREMDLFSFHPEAPGRRVLAPEGHGPLEHARRSSCATSCARAATAR